MEQYRYTIAVLIWIALGLTAIHLLDRGGLKKSIMKDAYPYNPIFLWNFCKLLLMIIAPAAFLYSIYDTIRDMYSIYLVKKKLRGLAKSLRARGETETAGQLDAIIKMIDSPQQEDNSQQSK